MVFILDWFTHYTCYVFEHMVKTSFTLSYIQNKSGLICILLQINVTNVKFEVPLTVSFAKESISL